MRQFPSHVLGVITWRASQDLSANKSYFREGSFYHRLVLASKKHGISLVFFDPLNINWETRTVPALYFDEPGFILIDDVGLPKLIYDRCCYKNGSQYLEYLPHIMRLQEDPEIEMLGYGLRGKLEVYNQLIGHTDLLKYLPNTSKYTSAQDVISRLSLVQSLILKPNGSSQGKGITSINYMKEDGRIHVLGRTTLNQPFKYKLNDRVALARWLELFVNARPYVVQQQLDLFTKNNRPCDVRILVQKNGEGKWQRTGMAARIGPEHSITSNLHGGGTALDFKSFLDQNYSDADTQKKIIQQINEVVSIIPEHLEEQHGKNLVELGIDLGVERDFGRVWIIEVNSKPGRALFKSLKDKNGLDTATEMPIAYAKFLFDRSSKQSSSLETGDIV